MWSADGMAGAGQVSGLGQRTEPTLLPLPGKLKGERERDRCIYIYIYIYRDIYIYIYKGRYTYI